MFRQINYLVKILLSRNFCQKKVRVKFRNLALNYTVRCFHEFFLVAVKVCDFHTCLFHEISFSVLLKLGTYYCFKIDFKRSLDWLLFCKIVGRRNFPLFR